MHNYIKFDYSISLKKKNYKIIIFILLLIFTILIFNIFINKNSNDEIKIVSKQSRRIINNLDNYTETISEFMVNNDLLNSFNEFKIKHLELKEKEIKIQENIKSYIMQQLENQENEIKLKKEIKEYIKNTIKNQEINIEFQKNKIKLEEDLKNKEINIQIRNNAINFLEKNYGIYSKDFNLDLFINNCNCVKELLNLDIDLFSLLLNIDYENLTISFNYFYNNKNSTDYYNYDKVISKTKYNHEYEYEYKYNDYKLLKNNKENIINNPIYKIIKNKLEFNSNNSINEALNYNADTNYDGYYHEKINIIDYNDIYYNTIENISFTYPYKSLCNINSINHTYYDGRIYERNGPYLHIVNSDYFDLYNKKIFFKQYYLSLNDFESNYNNYFKNLDKLNKYFLNYVINIRKKLNYFNSYTFISFNYIKIYNEYKYIKKFIDLENIPIIYPIKFY
jgi:hypothetical protein